MTTRKMVEVEYEDEGKIKKASSWQPDPDAKEEDELDREVTKVKTYKKEK